MLFKKPALSCEKKSLISSGKKDTHKCIDKNQKYHVLDRKYGIMPRTERSYFSSKNQNFNYFTSDLSTNSKLSKQHEVSSHNSCNQNLESISIWSSENKISEFVLKWCICEISTLSMHLCGDKEKQNANSLKYLRNSNFQNEVDEDSIDLSNIKNKEKFAGSNNTLDDASIENQKEESSNEINNPGYHIRKDVVIKNIFRSFRRFYCLQFSKFYDFSKKKMSRNHPSEIEIVNKVKRYVKKTFKEEDDEFLVALIVALLDPKGRYTEQKGVYEIMKQYVMNFFFKFNKKHLYDLFQISQFITLMKYFLNHHDVNSMIPRYHNNIETLNAYSNNIQILNTICTDQAKLSSKHLYKFF